MAKIDTDVECTPREGFEPVQSALDLVTFGTDPATNVHSIVPASRRIMLPEDGLALPWLGVVWCNPPYSKPRPWIERCIAHSDTAVALISGDFSTRMWRELIWPTAQLVVLLHKRLRFFNPATPDRKAGAKRPNALVFWRLDLERFNPAPLEERGECVIPAAAA